MPSLLDIAPSLETVEVNGQKIPVHGVSAEGIAYLLGAFPEVRALFAGVDVALDAEALFKLGPKIVAAIIAAGCGFPGNEEAERKAASFGIGVQLDFLDSIIKQTMPGGVGPFVAKLMGLLDQTNAAVESGKVRATKSQPPLNP